MDIIHESGKVYDLGDIQLTLSRMNPFFNDYGEQSLPVTLPPTDRNRELLIYPDNMAGISKASQRINAMIQHGVFSIPCRQAILSANRKPGSRPASTSIPERSTKRSRMYRYPRSLRTKLSNSRLSARRYPSAGTCSLHMTTDSPCSRPS